jgi:hypothetical protein
VHREKLFWYKKEEAEWSIVTGYVVFERMAEVVQIMSWTYAFYRKLKMGAGGTR